MKRLIVLLVASLLPTLALGQEIGNYPNATTPLHGTERILADQTSGTYPCIGCTVNITPAQILAWVTAQTASWSGTQTFATIGATTLTLTTPLAVTSGGTGTATPSLVPGTNITITGTWPNQTINSSGGGSMTWPAAAGIPCYSGSSSYCTSYSAMNLLPLSYLPLIPIATGVSGLGAGIATALGVNVGTAGAPVVNGGGLGTPSSGVATNLTGTATGLTAGLAQNLTGSPAITVSSCTGCGSGSSVTLQTNGTNNASQTALNLQSGSGITVTNPSGGNVSVSLASAPIPLTGYATASLPVCNSGAKGEIAYTTDGTAALTFCNGSSWVNSGGTQFTYVATGCTPSAASGDATGGSITLAAGPCTSIVVTFNGVVGMTAGHLWDCAVHDQTALAGGTWIPSWSQSSSTTTTATIPIPAAAGSTDVITFSCTPH